MKNAPKAAVARAAMAAFEPLASLFVELGVSSPEAESLLRSVLVHGVLRRELEAGNRANHSRIALLAGVHRNEVKRILSAPPGIDAERETRRHRANRILAAWHEDPDYLTTEGHPQDLPVRNHKRKRGASFWHLVARYAPGVWPGLILDELVRVGAVQPLPNQKLRVRTRAYGMGGMQTEELEEIGRRARDLLETLVHNLKNPASRRVCDTALALDVDPKWVPLLRNTLQRRAQAFIAAVNEDLNNERTRGAGHSTATMRVGLTVYSFEGAVAKRMQNGSTRKRKGRGS